jgi:hypothetical protein
VVLVAEVKALSVCTGVLPVIALSQLERRSIRTLFAALAGRRDEHEGAGL